MSSRLATFHKHAQRDTRSSEGTPSAPHELAAATSEGASWTPNQHLHILQPKIPPSDPDSENPHASTWRTMNNAGLCPRACFLCVHEAEGRVLICAATDPQKHQVHSQSQQLRWFREAEKVSSPAAGPTATRLRRDQQQPRPDGLRPSGAHHSPETSREPLIAAAMADFRMTLKKKESSFGAT